MKYFSLTFCLLNWFKDEMKLIMMERAATALLGHYRDGLDGPWTLVKDHIKWRQ